MIHDGVSLRQTYYASLLNKKGKSFSQTKVQINKAFEFAMTNVHTLHGKRDIV